MFKTLDVLIGFTLVMLIVSMAVTLLTQAIVGLMNLRGAALKAGVRDLLVLIDDGIDQDSATKIADHILRDPLVGQAKAMLSGRRLAAVVHREELTKLILGFGTKEKTDPPPARDVAARENIPKEDLEKVALNELRTKMRTSLCKNGVKDPEGTLFKIRAAAVELEKTNPELSNSVRTNTAILHFTTSDFLGKLNAWFDQTVDRAADIFTLRTRIVTACIAVIVAAVMQFDSLYVINRLQTDDALRNQLVKTAIEQQTTLTDAIIKRCDAAHPASATTPNPDSTVKTCVLDERRLLTPEAVAKNPDGQLKGPQTAEAAQRALVTKDAQELTDADLIRFPTSFGEWFKNWGTQKIWGVILSALLLSLGAPFWYEMLKNLVKLRSVVASKDDVQRNERQTNQPPSVAPGQTAAIPPVMAGGEKGDLDAKG